MSSRACSSGSGDRAEIDISGGREQGCCNAKQTARYPTEGGTTRKGRKKTQSSLVADQLIRSTLATSSVDSQKCSSGYLPS